MPGHKLSRNSSWFDLVMCKVFVDSFQFLYTQQLWIICNTFPDIIFWPVMIFCAERFFMWLHQLCSLPRAENSIRTSLKYKTANTSPFFNLIELSEIYLRAVLLLDFKLVNHLFSEFLILSLKTWIIYY